MARACSLPIRPRLFRRDQRLGDRRVCRVSSSYSSCHSDGPLDGMTCTAVTLYSGQLVAQSENSVVTTFTCVSGWWKVV